MRAFSHCYGTSTRPPNTNNYDIEQPPAQSEITIEGDFEQLNIDFVRSESLSGRQRVDGSCAAHRYRL